MRYGKSLAFGAAWRRRAWLCATWLYATWTCALWVGAAGVAMGEPPAKINIQAKQTWRRTTLYTVGACLEDVNHEVYGGIYSQMVFGESFQEPDPRAGAPRGFAAFGGKWTLGENGVLTAAAGEGPKLIAEEFQFESGALRAQFRFADKMPGNAGLLVAVSDPGVGADKFIGYEIALCPENGTIILGRHRQNWEPVLSLPCPVPTNQWITLEVRRSGARLEALVNGRSVLSHEDREHPLSGGKLGIRVWKRSAQFRKLELEQAGTIREVPFKNRDTADAVSGAWDAVRRGDVSGSLSLDAERPFVGQVSQRIAFASGQGSLGIANRGLNHQGMRFVEGREYQGWLWVRAEAAAEIMVSIESAAGQSYAMQTLSAPAGDWRRLEFSLTPHTVDAGDKQGVGSASQLTIALHKPGAVTLGYVCLQPGPWGRFKGLPVRKDVAEGLVAGGLTVLRYGGSMVNATEYRWKNMIGPRDRRPPYHGWWYPYSSNGWGIIDFLDFCEAAGFLAIPAFNRDETPGDLADFVEYVNGPVDSPWGRRRAADGHPASYGLKHLELGNEEAVDETYWRKFQPQAVAIWSKDPTITPVVGDFAYSRHIADPERFAGAPRIQSLAAHKKILDFAAGQGKPVWFDVHIGNDQPLDCDPQIVVLGELIDWLAKRSPQADFKVCVFEENAGNHLLRRGLAHARTINGLARLGERVPIVCMANCLQPDGQNDNGWDQGMLFLSPNAVWGQPSYYVTQMFSAVNYPDLLAVDYEGPAGFDALARRSPTGERLALQVVNPGDAAAACEIRCAGFLLGGKTVHATQLAGTLTDDNSEREPQRIAPWQREFIAPAGEALNYVFPAHSVTVLLICAEAG